MSSDTLENARDTLLVLMERPGTPVKIVYFAVQLIEKTFLSLLWNEKYLIWSGVGTSLAILD